MGEAKIGILKKEVRIMTEYGEMMWGHGGMVIEILGISEDYSPLEGRMYDIVDLKRFLVQISAFPKSIIEIQVEWKIVK